ncbi:cholesterol oxidase [Mycobacteroides franklinii]|uniref:Cholesterol oxidase n=1 Tax=Mycobacteroides franklinii TaxID=948102 RepID=A0A1S1LCI0_9MYCO|nr:GMC oxidoreductase [Mycobacteroides franklinii]OHU26764.1 cholesterol oxidase [Mycobacteroides franklinii]
MTLVSRRQLFGAAAAGALSFAAYNTLGDRRRHDRQHYTAIVVGTGYGGGVSALRLGQAGIDTLVLEKGRLWDTPDSDGRRFTPVLPVDSRSSWFASGAPSLVPSYNGISLNKLPGIAKQPLQAGICAKETHGAHDVFRGIAVGGGSLINAGIAAIPTFNQVRAAFPDIDPVEFRRTYLERAKSMLRINYRPTGWFEKTPWFQYARVGRRYAGAAGFDIDYNGSSYSFGYMQREAAGIVPRSALALEQQYGNNFGRFGSVDRTYIAAALQTGHVTLRPLTEAVSIRQESADEYVVTIRQIDRWGTELSTTEISCRSLFLAAGVLGTVKLLLRARETGDLQNLGEEIGQDYGNNGDIMVSHNLSARDPAGTQQSLMGMISLDNRNDPADPLYANIFSIPLPVETHALAYYAMTRTEDRSDITYDIGNDEISIRWPQAYTDHLWDRARTTFNKVVHGNRVDYRDDLFEGSPYRANTVHPLGGCVRAHATDENGRVKGYRRLYVNDASLIPGYLGVNPFLTIAALAERNIERVLSDITAA